MDAKQLLKALWFTPGVNGRWGLPIIFKGAPGTAKTSIVNAVAKECGLHVETVLASLRQPEDFLGLPIPAKTDIERNKLLDYMRPTGAKAKETDDGEYTFSMVEYAPPRWAVRLAQAKRGVAFFDEVNTAPPSVQAALLRVVLEGVVGELELPTGIRCVACMNPTDDAANGWDIAPPLANRFGHVQWPAPDVKAWTEYMLGGNEVPKAGFSAEKEEKNCQESWGQNWAWASGLVTSFLRSKQSLLLKQPLSSDPAASEAWPSPRSWENATRAMAGGRLHGLDNIQRFEMVAAFVGAGAASELDAYSHNMDLPDTEALLDGKVTWKHDPARLDRTCAVLSSCGALLVATDVKRKERIASLWSLLANLIEDVPDIIYPVAKVMVKNLAAEVTSPNAIKVLNAIFPVGNAAGMGGRR